jgi:hypothetical protein
MSNPYACKELTVVPNNFILLETSVIDDDEEDDILDG